MVSLVYLEAMMQLEQLKAAHAEMDITDAEFLDCLEQYKGDNAMPVVPCRNSDIRWALIMHSDKNIYPVLKGYFSGKKLNEAGCNLLALSYIMVDGYRYNLAKRTETGIELNAELFSTNEEI